MSASNKRLGRRHALAGIGLAAGAAVPVVGVLASRDRRTVPAPEAGTSNEAQVPNALAAHELREADAEVRALFGPLMEGERVGSCRIESIYAARGGAIPVVLSTSNGRRFAVEIFAADPLGPQPLASAAPLALFLVNRGDGASPTPEDVGSGVLALGRALARRIEDGAPAPGGLVSYAERHRRAPTGVFHVPV